MYLEKKWTKIKNYKNDNTLSVWKLSTCSCKYNKKSSICYQYRTGRSMKMNRSRFDAWMRRPWRAARITSVRCWSSVPSTGRWALGAGVEGIRNLFTWIFNGLGLDVWHWFTWIFIGYGLAGWYWFSWIFIGLGLTVWYWFSWILIGWGMGV